MIQIIDIIKEDLNKSGIYKIYNNINSKIYIGSAVNFRKRLNLHKVSLKNNKHSNKHLQNHFNKYGESSLFFEIIMFCEVDHLIKNEQVFIDKCIEEHQDLFNIRLIADSNLGVQFTEEHKRKISDSEKGKIVTEETRKKLFISKMGHVGRTWSKEQKEEQSIKLIGKNIGKIRTQEFKDNLSILYKGTKKPNLIENKNANRKAVIDTVTGQIFESVVDAANFYNIKRTTLINQLKERYKNKTNLIYYDSNN